MSFAAQSPKQAERDMALQPYPFQVEDAEWLSRQNRALICSDLGTGKTVVALGALERTVPRPALIVCPAPLKLKWQYEVGRWLGHEAVILGGSHRHHDDAWNKVADICIINYEALRQRVEQIKHRQWSVVILDESHRIKNRKAQTTKAAWMLRRCCQPQHLWLMSANPMPLGVSDLWAQLKMLWPGQYTSFWRFVQRHCYVTQGQWGWEIGELRDEQELARELEPFTRRRRWEDVLPDMPGLLREFVPIEETRAQAQARDELMTELAALLAERVVITPGILAMFTRLRQTAIYPELMIGEAAATVPKFQYIEAMLEEDPAPLVIFSSFNVALDALDACLQQQGISTVCLRGGSADVAAWEFQQGSAQVLTASLQAVRDGLDLQRAWRAVFLDIPPTWAASQSCEARLHRIGQTHPVQITYLATVNTIDTSMYEVVVTRQQEWTALFDELAQAIKQAQE